ncbi:MAG: hypothetical protein AB8B64_12775 [Granulosicoccus sp.]
MENFWFNEIIKAAVLFSSAFLLGKWVLTKEIRVNYTRKILHFILFFLPIYLASLNPFEHTLATILISGVNVFVCLGLFAEPFRRKSVFLATSFAALDRPEDRPFTLLWLSTQVLATYAVLVIMLAWLSRYDAIDLIYITVLIAGIGDGLAEPVGIRFGKRKYSTYALFSSKKYVRTVEGSLCVFVSGLLAVALFHTQLDSTQLIVSLLVIPIAMTLAEAWSPHTWDSPFLCLVGGSSTVLVLEVSKIL